MPIKCPQCGTENLDGALFCDECGASLTEEAPTPPETPTPSEAAPPEVVPQEAPETPPAEAEVGIKCPSCGHQNPPNARFCENCGASLERGVAPSPPVVAKIIVADAGTELPLDFNKGEVLLGRTDPVSHIYPDVDLTPHGGYEAGVSRRHCRILQQGDQFFVEDLESTNGTRLNDQFIPPKQPRLLQNGDVLELGKLKLIFRIEGTS